MSSWFNYLIVYGKQVAEARKELMKRFAALVEELVASQKSFSWDQEWFNKASLFVVNVEVKVANSVIKICAELAWAERYSICWFLKKVLLLSKYMYVFQK